MRHRHQGRYRSRTRRGRTIHKRNPLHPLTIRKARFVVPRKMPAGWVASKRYGGWTEIPVTERRIVQPREIVIRRTIPLGLFDVEKPQRLPTRLIRNDRGKIIGVAL